ncbi:MAG: efflux RND transporter periplasmic adaptor subunit [Chloroflexota bacterium]
MLNRKTTSILFMLLALGTLIACSGAAPEEEAIVSTDPIENENQALTIEGEVVPQEYVDLSFEQNGEVIDILVSEGDTVAVGAPLIILDDRELQLNLKRAEVSKDQAERSVEAAEAGLLSAQASLEVAQVGVKAAEAELALITADPTSEQITLNALQVDLGDASLSSASGQLTLTLEGAGSGQIALAQAELEAAQADLVPLQIQQSQNSWGDINLSAEEENQLNLQIAAAYASIEAANAQLIELQAGATSSERFAASSSVSSATANRDAAAADQALFLAGPREEQISLNRIALAQAEAAVAEAELRIALEQEKIADAQTAVLEAEKQIALAQESLEKTVLRSTLDGTIAELNINLGEIAVGSRPVVTVADFSGWEIETTDLTEIDVVDVPVGESITVLLDAYPGTPLNGQVVDVASNATLSLGDVTYVATIGLETSEAIELRWGMTAVGWLASDAPPSSLRQSQSVLAEAEIVPAQVSELGFQLNGTIAEILVEEGDNVQAGDLLIRLNSDDATIRRDQAEIEVQSAEIALNTAKAQLELSKAQIETNEQQIASGEANLALLLADPRPEEIEAAEKRIEASQADLNQAIGQRDMTLTSITDSQIASAEAQLLSAQSQFTAVQDQYETVITTCFDVPDKGEVCPLLGPVEEQTRAQVTAAESQVVAAQAQLDQLLAGPTNGQRSASQGGVSIAATQVELAEAQLALLMADPMAEEVAVAQVSIEQAQASKQAAEASVAVSEANVRIAEVALEMAQIELENRELALEQYLVRAPFDGTINQLRVKVGNQVAPGSGIITLADFSTWEIETTDLTELDIASVEVGDEVSVEIDAIPGQTVNGTVGDIAFISSVFQGDIVYRVTVIPEDVTALPLRWGMTSFVAIE